MPKIILITGTSTGLGASIALLAARAGQIINISSVGGLVGQPFNEVYCAS